MDRLQRAFEIFVESLNEAHIPSITVDGPYHQDTEALYELAFKFYHLWKEARQNMEIDEAVEVEDIASKTYDLSSELEDLILTEVNENKNIGYDDILRWLAQEALSVCGKMKRYQRKVEEKEEKPEEEKKEEKKTSTISEYLKTK